MPAEPQPEEQAPVVTDARPASVGRPDELGDVLMSTSEHARTDPAHSGGLGREAAGAARRRRRRTDCRRQSHFDWSAPLPPWTPAAFGPREFLAHWAGLVRERLPTGTVVQCWPHEIGDLSRVTMAIVFDPPPGLLARCPNLRLVHSMGAGVSPGMLDAGVVPHHVPLLRLVDPLMAQRMATFCLWAVINLQRKA